MCSWRMGGGPVLSAPSAEHDQSRCSADSSTHGTYHIRPRRPVPPASNLLLLYPLSSSRGMQASR